MDSKASSSQPREIFRAPLRECVSALAHPHGLAPEPFLMLKARDDGDLIRPFATRLVLLSSVREALDLCLDHSGDLPRAFQSFISCVFFT